MSIIGNVVIAAAGMGTRLGIAHPKCLVEICGKKIIEYQLDLLKNVPNVFIIVGFCEQEVMNFVKTIRPDAIFVRNPNFQHTKTLESFYLASRVIRGKAIFMDGGMILEPNSLKKFLDKGSTEKFLIAITQRISEDPVYANVQTEHPLIIKEFSFTKKSNYEWANIVSIEASWLQSGTSHVFEYLSKFLPASAAVIDRMEIDTPENLRYAEQRLASGDPWM